MTDFVSSALAALAAAPQLAAWTLAIGALGIVGGAIRRERRPADGR